MATIQKPINKGIKTVNIYYHKRIENLPNVYYITLRLRLILFVCGIQGTT